MRDLTIKCIGNLLRELVDGPADFGGWVLDREAPGIVACLQNIPADAASKRLAGRNSIASHTSHALYAIELINRWAGGEENPFASADWKGSWQPQTVTDDEWDALIKRFESEAHAWSAALPLVDNWDEIALTGAMASAVHLAYHLGAIRQLWLILSAPSESK